MGGTNDQFIDWLSIDFCQLISDRLQRTARGPKPRSSSVRRSGSGADAWMPTGATCPNGRRRPQRAAATESVRAGRTRRQRRRPTSFSNHFFGSFFISDQWYFWTNFQFWYGNDGKPKNIDLGVSAIFPWILIIFLIGKLELSRPIIWSLGGPWIFWMVIIGENSQKIFRTFLWYSEIFRGHLPIMIWP